MRMEMLQGDTTYSSTRSPTDRLLSTESSAPGPINYTSRWDFYTRIPVYPIDFYTVYKLTKPLIFFAHTNWMKWMEKNLEKWGKNLENQLKSDAWVKNNRLLWNVFSVINILHCKKLFSIEHTVVYIISNVFPACHMLNYLIISILAWHVCVLMKNVIYFDLSALLKLLRHYRSDTLEEWKFNMTMSSCHDFKILCYWAGFVWVIALISFFKQV